MRHDVLRQMSKVLLLIPLTCQANFCKNEFTKIPHYVCNHPVKPNMFQSNETGTILNVFWDTSESDKKWNKLTHVAYKAGESEMGMS